jgi:ribosomal protein L11 methyltransferase
MHELVLLASQAQAEPVADALMELGARSVAVEDADADTPQERALFGEPGMPAPRAGWKCSTLRALFDDEDAATGAAALLLAQDVSHGVHLQAIAPLAEQDWVRLTQSQFAPVEVAKGFWIVPTWHAPPAEARVLMRLDPGLAFGTGTHPTTRMCLRWIADRAPAEAARWERVLDYGCGSGILAIGAALHGARHVDAVDIDPVAITATLDNARAHALSGPDRLRAGAPELAHGHYDLVLANILAAPLKLLAPLLAAYVGDGGHLVLAGILERQADELAAAYAPWLPLQVHDREDGWVLMVARRSS